MPTITIGSSANVLEASENKGPKISFFRGIEGMFVHRQTLLNGTASRRW